MRALNLGLKLTQTKNLSVVKNQYSGTNAFAMTLKKCNTRNMVILRL